MNQKKGYFRKFTKFYLC